LTSAGKNNHWRTGKAYSSAVPGADIVMHSGMNSMPGNIGGKEKWQQIINVAAALSVLICCLGLFGLTHLATHMRVKELVSVKYWVHLS